jgi:hypothetical protein
MGSKRRLEDRMHVVISADLDARELEVLRLQIERLARELGAQITAWRVEDAGR